MSKVNTLYDFIALENPENIKFSFAFIQDERKDCYLHFFPHCSKTIFINAIPFELSEHGVEIHRGEVYDPIFQDYQEFYFKYFLNIKNSIFGRSHRIEILININGFIDNIHILSALEHDSNEKHIIPGQELDLIIEFSESYIYQFYTPMSQAHKQYTRDLETKFKQEIKALYQIIYEPPQNLSISFVLDMMQNLYQLSRVYPNDYAILYKCFTYLYERSADVTADLEYTPEYAKCLTQMQKVLTQKPKKSSRNEAGELCFHDDYLDHILNLMTLSDTILDNIFKLDTELNPADQFMYLVQFCVINEDFLAVMLDFFKAQIIIQDYTYFKETLKFCGDKISLNSLDALIAQDNAEYVLDIINELKLDYHQLHQITETLITDSRVDCLIALNRKFPINYLYIASHRKPLLSLVLNLAGQHPIRQFLFAEHRQFRTMQTYHQFIHILQGLPWYMIKEDLAMARHIIYKAQQGSSSSSSSQNHLFFATPLELDKQLNDKVLFHQLMQEDLKRQLMQHTKINEHLVQAIYALFKSQIHHFRTLIKINDAHLILTLITRFEKLIHHIYELLDLSTQLKGKSCGFNRSSKRQFHQLQNNYNQLIDTIQTECNSITDEAKQATEGINQELITDLHDLMDALDNSQEQPSAQQWNRMHQQYQTVLTRYSSLIHAHDELIIEKIFFLGFAPLMTVFGHELESKKPSI